MAALALAGEREFTVPEASAILGVSTKDLNNAVARELRPLGVAKVAGGCLSINRNGLIAFAVLRAIGRLFTPEFRRTVLRQTIRVPSEDCVSVQKGCVVVNIAEYREKVSVGTNRLRAAEAMVSSNPEVLSGEPCIRGTRVPVYLVGALARKHGVEKAHATYPFLTREQVELVALYVKANPRRGRPPQTQLPKAKAATRRGGGKKIRV